jgi:hypothetical protein
MAHDWATSQVLFLKLREEEGISMKKTVWIGILAGIMCLLIIDATNSIHSDIEARPNAAVSTSGDTTVAATNAIISTAKHAETTAHELAVESVSLLSLGAGLLFIGGALRGRLRRRSQASVSTGKSLECESTSCA